jgi:hypothetical protein
MPQQPLLVLVEVYVYMYPSAAGRGLTVIFNTVIKSLPRLDGLSESFEWWKLVQRPATLRLLKFLHNIHINFQLMNLAKP